ncbi:MAG: DNA polymerase IV [Alphaproteobacteria bacterium]|nr:DNA polymerase IV [Alphaproteobacteria bacterium]
MSRLCRDCLKLPAEVNARGRCLACGSPRHIQHDELEDLHLAHIDCDAFYASVEKRDRPELADKPVIVGGRHRGVVTAACYVARLYGVRSAMPMFKALKACPEAVVIRPDMEKYVRVGREVRQLMLETTPLVEAVSIDEAFLDLAGTERLHGGPPARTLAQLALKIERELRVTVSIGLSINKFMAKIASDRDKPRGFAVIGTSEVVPFLATQPVGLIFGVGNATRERLAKDGITMISQLQDLPELELMRRYGSMGRRLSRLSRGDDDRGVDPEREAVGISAETTFDEDLSTIEDLSKELWGLAERVSYRLKRQGLSGAGVALKLKTSGFKILTRHRSLESPTQLADQLYRAALPMLKREADGTKYRLIGIGADHLKPFDGDDTADLLDPSIAKRAKAERAMDKVRDKLGEDAVVKGRGFVSES